MGPDLGPFDLASRDLAKIDTEHTGDASHSSLGRAAVLDERAQDATDLGGHVVRRDRWRQPPRDAEHEARERVHQDECAGVGTPRVRHARVAKEQQLDEELGLDRKETRILRSSPELTECVGSPAHDRA